LIDIEPADLVVLNRDGLDWPPHQALPLLCERGAYRCVLDRDHIWLEPLRQRDRDTARPRILIPTAKVLPFLVGHQPGGAHRPIVLGATPSLDGRRPDHVMEDFKNGR